MKRIILALVILFAICTTAYPKTATITFDAPTDSSHTTWVIYGTEQGIAEGLAAGTYGQANGQISLPGATEVSAGGFVPGVTYYFTAVRVDELDNKSAYADEISYLIPENAPVFYQELYPIEVNNQVFTIQISVE